MRNSKVTQEEYEIGRNYVYKYIDWLKTGYFQYDFAVRSKLDGLAQDFLSEEEKKIGQ